jgi:hypothetical protein
MKQKAPHDSDKTRAGLFLITNYDLSEIGFLTYIKREIPTRFP